MHEMSICQSLVEILEEQAKTHRFKEVKTVRLEVGPLAAVEPEAMRFCFEVATRGTLAEKARLEILIPEISAFCFDCGQTATIADPQAGCPKCGGHKLQLGGGKELRIKDLEVV